MAYIAVAYMVVAYMGVAYMVVAYMVVAYMVMAYIVMAYIAMALDSSIADVIHVSPAVCVHGSARERKRVWVRVHACVCA